MFSSLIGGQGIYAVTPGATFVWGGSYQPGSLIWRSRWVTTEGVVECQDALAFPAAANQVIVLRRLSAHGAAASVRVLLDPRAGFAGSGLTAVRREKRDRWTARLGDLYLRWSGNVSRAQAHRGRRGRRLTLSFSVKPGEHCDLMLELSDRPFAGKPADPDRLWKSTQAEWDKAVPRLDSVLAPRDARHAYAVMRGLTSSDDGMVAAVTTSLPERAEAGRNYDYRYAWIRDQCFAGQAAAAAGAPALLDTAVRFVAARLHCDGPALAPAYTTDGGPVPDERRLGLPGYRAGSTWWGTGCASSSSSTCSERRCCCSPPPPGWTGWTPAAGGRPKSPLTRSPPAGAAPARAGQGPGGPDRGRPVPGRRPGAHRTAGGRRREGDAGRAAAAAQAPRRGHGAARRRAGRGKPGASP
ncbi:MAG TPA: glycoside hydrolase family 15 protein [Streptosporangiaceae bacterium]